ncbi:hypothetical protein [Streptomyces shenzhenensis]|uniref:Uncharacterized protein n=1 Tax=Streptomyces shenzhenensis TaxID=943815 RepID=A0A3M0I3G5_9ACTN|nr:hypothetical protein [Streptomyces shenzhenensis]RMB81303.1 hypothetical protein CTZ28_35480 [Streptomyces shenzhenensis]
MTELPTTAEPSTTDNHRVQRALAEIEAAKQDCTPDVVKCLDDVADLVRQTGDPDAVFASVLDGFAREEIRVLAATHQVRLIPSTPDAVSSGVLTETVVFWQYDGSSLAAVPHGQRSVDTLAQLRAAIAERAEEQELADDFQASVAAGHVEDIESWHARTSTRASR